MQDSEKISLADVMEQTAPKTVEFDLSRIDMSRLTLMEIYDLCEAAGIEPEQMSSAIEEGTAVRARVIYAVAWVILRRVQPELTYEEVSRYDLEVSGKLDSNVESKRAKTTVGVAALAGVSPQEAEGMTLGEIHAVTELAERRNRAARRRARH